MHNIASQGRKNGGNLAFVSSVGDIWQNQSIEIDPDHKARGFGQFDDPELVNRVEITDKTLSFEVPLAIEGYKLLSDAEVKFGVVPGNHDYDARWYEGLREMHIGGLENFLSAFSAQSQFFKDKPWYIDAYNGGTSSAQKFTAGGHTFLHLAFEMQASDGVLAWAQNLINLNPGLPTIITTHDYLSPQGERQSTLVEMSRIDPGYHNSADQVWEKLIRKNDQVFMVLSGHQRGQSLRIDLNDAGNQVYQIMVDYQDRGQAGLDAGQALSSRGIPMAIGDGWYRIMEFNLEAKLPYIEFSTYSSHYDVLSSDLETYASWYKDGEQPDMTDSEFYAADEYTITLTDFNKRFAR